MCDSVSLRGSPMRTLIVLTFRLPTTRSAASTMQVAALPCVMTTTPVSPTAPLALYRSARQVACSGALFHLVPTILLPTASKIAVPHRKRVASGEPLRQLLDDRHRA